MCDLAKSDYSAPGRGSVGRKYRQPSNGHWPEVGSLRHMVFISGLARRGAHTSAAGYVGGVKTSVTT